MASHYWHNIFTLNVNWSNQLLKIINTDFHSLEILVGNNNEQNKMKSFI